MLLLGKCAIIKTVANIYIYYNYKHTNTLQFVVLFTPGPRDIAPAGTFYSTSLNTKEGIGTNKTAPEGSLHYTWAPDVWTKIVIAL